MANERGYSAATRRVRLATVAQAGRILADRDHELVAATREDVMAFLAAYPHIATRNRCLADLRAFFEFLVGTKHRKDNPCEQIRTLREPRRLPRPLTNGDAGKLLSTAEQTRLTAYVMVMLAFYGGLRRAEIASLRWCDVDLAAGEIRVVGKGDKERVVPIPSRLVAALHRWEETRHQRALPAWERTGRVHLFPSLYGDHRSIHPTSVNIVIAKVARAAGVDATPHQGRHSYATALLDTGSDIRVVQELLGHASLASTQIYTAVSVARMRQDVGRLDFGEADERSRSNEGLGQEDQELAEALAEDARFFSLPEAGQETELRARMSSAGWTNEQIDADLWERRHRIPLHLRMQMEEGAMRPTERPEPDGPDPPGH